ncbi:alpha/beta hydrolase-fold protein [Mucilaginibacter sp. PAMB04274]|uniref:esterase family protein n=1 Tax=Mucilaginibacter sp. PAMB04274 TaxID=3138568 RepID=UPI0031F6E860
MNREYHKWFSNVLQRDMELLVFGHGGRAVLFFPTRMARFYDYENWGVVGALFEKLENGELQLFCVDSIDAESFYNKTIEPRARIERHLQYEEYILGEVLPFMHQHNSGRPIEVAGCSMGAYHAVNLALRHAEKFVKVVGMSGRYDLTVQMENYNDLFDGYRDEDIYFNMPQEFMANLSDENILNRIKQLDMVIAVGEADPFLHSNQELSRKLLAHDIQHEFYIWDGNGHRPRYWRQMVQLYL